MIETKEQQRQRLAPVLATLDASGRSVFLDLCELVLMVAERVSGSICWTHPRAIVRIKHPKSVRKAASKAKASA